MTDLPLHLSYPPCFALPLSEVADGTAVDIFSFGMCALEVLAPPPSPPPQVGLHPFSPMLSLLGFHLALTPDGCAGDSG